MKHIYHTILVILISLGAKAQGNNFVVLSGTIIDQDSQISLPGVSVSVKNTVSGTATNGDGKFELRTKASFPFYLVVSSIGFKTQEFEIKGAGSNLKIALITQTQLGQEVIVTASRVEESILKSPGFNIVWKWQDAFLWESPLGNGEVKAFNTFDAQVTYKVPRAKATVKAGATNIFNTKYLQYAGGPTLGGLYYIAITFDGLLN